MPDPSPPGPSPSTLVLGGLALLAVGGITGQLLHDLAGLRPFVPPAFSSGNTLACTDLNAYVEHVTDLQDHRIHATTFGIHRQKTIDAVNELYDRARCGAQKDGAGHETYQTLKATVEPDTNDPRSEAAPPPARAVIQNAYAPPPGPYVPPPVRVDDAATPLTLRPILRRRHVVIVNDGTLDAQATAPVVQPPPAKPLDCGPPGIDWGVRGCTYPHR